MLVKILFVKVPTFRLKLQPSLGESDKEFVEKARSYTMQIGKSELIMFCPLGLNLKTSCGKCIPSSRFSGFLQALISHASKIRLLRQFVLVRKIFEDSQEMVWPECKQCSAKADLCECLMLFEPGGKFSCRFSDVAFVTTLTGN